MPEAVGRGVTQGVPALGAGLWCAVAHALGDGDDAVAHRGQRGGPHRRATRTCGNVGGLGLGGEALADGPGHLLPRLAAALQQRGDRVLGPGRCCTEHVIG